MKSSMHHRLVTLREKIRASFKSLGIRATEYPSQPGFMVLAFHGIDDRNSTRFNTRFISRKKLEALLILLKKNTHLVSLSDGMAGKLIPDRLNIAITFDDGYHNNLTHALPLLERYQIPASIFSTCIHLAGKNILFSDLYDLCCDRLPHSITLENARFVRNASGVHTTLEGINIKTFAAGCGKQYLLKLYEIMEPYALFKKKSSYDVYWKLLSPSELTQLAHHPLITIGSHGVMHLNFPFVDKATALEDMLASKTELERLISKPVEHLAFPFGTCTPELIRLATQVGYHCVYADPPAGNVPEDLTYAQTRFGINPFISASSQFLYIKKGSY